MRFVVLLWLGSVAAAAHGEEPLSLSQAIQLVSPSVVAIQCVFGQLPEQTQAALHAPFIARFAVQDSSSTTKGTCLQHFTWLKALKARQRFPSRKARKQIHIH